MRLLLLRHAKSLWDEPEPDADRPLNARGRTAAGLMGRHMAARGLVPGRALVSAARRTRETVALLLPHLADAAPAPVFLGSLYDSRETDYVAVIRREGGDADCLLVVGHQPAIAQTALVLVGGGDRTVIHAIRAKFPTGALAVIDFDGDGGWPAIAPGTGRAVAFIRPRDLAATAG